MKDNIPVDLDKLSELFEEKVPEYLHHYLVKWEDHIRKKILTDNAEPLITPHRWRLPDERKSITHRFNIAGSEQSMKGYLTLGMYRSGRIGEIFLEIAKEGSFASGIMDGLMTTLSIGLQHGVPIKSYINKFKYSRFEPSGQVRAAPKGVFGANGMKHAVSMLDYIARYLEFRFPDGYLDDDEHKAKQDETQKRNNTNDA